MAVRNALSPPRVDYGSPPMLIKLSMMTSLAVMPKSVKRVTVGSDDECKNNSDDEPKPSPKMSRNELPSYGMRIIALFRSQLVESGINMHIGGISAAMPSNVINHSF